MSYNRILAAIDLSKESQQIISKAKETADTYGAKLYLISAIEPLLQVHGDVLSNYGAYRSIDNEAKEELKERLMAICKDIGISSKNCFVPIGNPAYEIKQRAFKLKSDLIVIGTHGRKGIKKLLLGSTANSVLNGTKTDVQVIRIA